jgi:hypothetical protein
VMRQPFRVRPARLGRKVILGRLVPLGLRVQQGRLDLLGLLALRAPLGWLGLLVRRAMPVRLELQAQPALKAM